MNSFLSAVALTPQRTPPVWMMRQAGRYHSHYQALRKKHSFDTLCRVPELAAEVTMGPIQDFDFDAAILFSDLLYPLEALGFGLSYDDGPPKLDGALDEKRLASFRSTAEALPRLTFQRDAMRAVRERLPVSKGLIGFVGGPWTLFVYAMEGTHAGALAKAKASPALYRAFADQMTPLLIQNIKLQFDGGADVVMLFDTAAGELSPEMFNEWTLPDLQTMARAFPGKLGYYAKGVSAERLLSMSAFVGASGDPTPARRAPALEDSLSSREPRALFAGVGIDWNQNLASSLTSQKRAGFLQGNFDPTALASDHDTFKKALDRFIAPLKALTPEQRRGWVCGLGHGVLPPTPENHVREFIATVREVFV